MESTRIRNELRASGASIGGNDTVIAGHALAADCVLVTDSKREFGRVKSLRVEEWVANQARTSRRSLRPPS